MDVIHDRARREKHLPMAALGLPLVCKDQYEVRATKRRNGKIEQLRRASPLWLRVVEGNGDACSPSLWNVFLPGSVSVDLWKANTHRRQLMVGTEDARTRGGVDRWAGCGYQLHPSPFGCHGGIHKPYMSSSDIEESSIQHAEQGQLITRLTSEYISHGRSRWKVYGIRFGQQKDDSRTEAVSS